MQVAPYAGAWIEMLGRGFRIPFRWVAPYAGAWIEILHVRRRYAFGRRRSLRGSVD